MRVLLFAFIKPSKFQEIKKLYANQGSVYPQIVLFINPFLKNITLEWEKIVQFHGCKCFSDLFRYFGMTVLSCCASHATTRFIF